MNIEIGASPIGGECPPPLLKQVAYLITHTKYWFIFVFVPYAVKVYSYPLLLVIDNVLKISPSWKFTKFANISFYLYTNITTNANDEPYFLLF